MTFDAWETGIRPSEDCLMHWGIRGMKHGTRRYQNEDGTWTEAGLAARRKREGWGEKRAERKEARKVEKAEKKAVRQEKRIQRKEARQQALAKVRDERRRSNVKTMTDEELAASINRLKMEKEYRDLKRSPLAKAGEKLITDYFQNKTQREERAYAERNERRAEAREKRQQEFEMKKMKEQTKQTELRSDADKARADADKTRAETDKFDIAKGTRMRKLKNEGKSLKLQRKRYTSDNTIMGGARKMINAILTGRGKAKATERVGNADVNVATRKGSADANIAVRQAKKLNRYNKKLKAGDTRAEIPEGGFVPRTSSDDGEGKKKKNKKGGGSAS